MNTIEFDVLETVSHEDFCRLVEKYLNEGWEFHGHLIAFPNFIDPNDGVTATKYVQAFIRKPKTV